MRAPSLVSSCNGSIQGISVKPATAPGTLPGLSSPASTPALRAVSPPILRSIKFIEASFSQPVDLAAISSSAGLSVSRFADRFRSEVGMPPHRFLCLVRIRQAQHMLRAGVAPSVVATAVGFFDQSHLGRHFRRVVGTTPRHFMTASATPVR